MVRLKAIIRGATQGHLRTGGESSVIGHRLIRRVIKNRESNQTLINNARCQRLINDPHCILLSQGTLSVLV